jgi:tetratricopeptide (TPR) repeat protein
VLITSRRQRWPSGLRVQTQRLAVLARQSSIALLQQLAPRLTTDEADAIAAELGDLPLALQLAASYLAQFERTRVAAYLAELTSAAVINHPSLEGVHDEDVSLTAHDRHVGRTFLVSYQHLDADNPTDALALKLLARAACLAPGEPIPLDLLLATVVLDAESTDGQRALQRLINLSLLTSEAEDAVQMHRLVHAFVQAVMPDATALAAVEDVLSTRALAINREGYPTAMHPLVSHLRWMTAALMTRTDLSMMALAIELASHLYATGDYAAVQPLFERALAICEQVLGPDHPQTATSLNNLAVLLDSTGNYAGARPLYERALAIKEQMLGPDDPSIALSLNNLAYLLYTMGDYAGARPLYKRALALAEQALGPDHPNTATILNNLALLLEDTGNTAAAWSFYERALTIREQTLGPDHPDTATSLNNLAHLLHTMGNYTAARSLYERALALAEQALGPDHPKTATSLLSLASLLLTTGKYAEARPMMERALAIVEHALGPYHPITAASLNNLAGLLHSLRDYTGARRLFERALAINEQALGPNHPDTALSLNNLAGVLAVLEDSARARWLFERALAIREQALGPDHPDTTTIRDNLAALDAAEQGSPGDAQNCPADRLPAGAGDAGASPQD